MPRTKLENPAILPPHRDGCDRICRANLSTLGDERSVPVKLCRSVFWLSLYAPPPTRCYNAGVKDVATRLVESPMDNAKLVELCRTKDGVEAALIQAALEDAGIRVRVEGDML